MICSPGHSHVSSHQASQSLENDKQMQVARHNMQVGVLDGPQGLSVLRSFYKFTRLRTPEPSGCPVSYDSTKFPGSIRDFCGHTISSCSLTQQFPSLPFPDVTLNSWTRFRKYWSILGCPNCSTEFQSLAFKCLTWHATSPHLPPSVKRACQYSLVTSELLVWSWETCKSWHWWSGKAWGSSTALTIMIWVCANPQ